MNECQYYGPRREVRCTECGLDESLCTCGYPNEGAHHRLFSRQGLFLRRVLDEFDQLEKQGYSKAYLLTQFSYQAGVIARAMQERDQGLGITDEEVYTELIRASVLLAQIATAGDGGFAYEPSAIYGE